MRGMKKILGVVVLALVLPVILGAVLGEPSSTPQFYARIDITLSTEEFLTLDFGSKSIISIAGAAEPPGFSVDRVVVVFQGGAPSGLIPVKYDSISESMGRITSISSRSGEVVVASNGFNGTVPVRVITYFRKTSWKPIKGNNITVDTSEFTGLNLPSVRLKVTLDNYAPYSVAGVLGPSGENLLDVDLQEKLGPSVIKFDPKHVEVDVSKVGFGVYTVKLAQGEENKLPNAMLVVEDTYIETSVPAKSSKVFNLRGRTGWNPLGFIVVVYSVAPGPLSANVRVESEMTNYVFSRAEEFDIRGASLLIPPLLMHYWIKGYIAFGQAVKVVNNENRDIQVLLVPVYYKEVGTWTPRGLIATISKADIGNAYSAFLVVQVPSIARITSIETPSGQVLQGKENYTGAWLGTWRTAVIEPGEAAVMVKNGDAVEDGTYKVNIEWRPLRVKFVDSKGYPISGVEATLKGSVSASAVSGADGVATLNVYAPGVYTLTGVYKGSNIASMVLGTLIDTDLEIKCPVYNLNVKVVNALGAPITGATVTVSNNGGFTQSMETDASGKALFQQLPGAQYTIEVNYKRISTKSTLTLTQDQDITINTGVLFEIPLLGPITVMETLTLGAAALLTSALYFGVRKGREEEVAEIEID
ncbi:carboxypeptidase-like regulatory domain-containing protein [Thermofilum pendens]|uniref:Carboxypeptidase regulatory-like domain-containing protein n=1 Tax=Thermofilum pendens (strain DSM 2475 / Hrk 5) TaxID=368408 RepID=A1RX26_THEPD|nr:carboxypeptidase-like regulatory domain-containing protein [Thermofilum pendens]ABL77756.1 hypothetical protein Tpen_0347 [Thermofilum pendens Hrk 5]